MSKKQANSEQKEVALPDWADEVTPSDEVMRKFYAPTGAFRPGPITPPTPPTPEPASDTTHVEEAFEEPFKEPDDAPAGPEITPEPAPEPPAPVNLTPPAEPEAVSLPTPKIKRGRGRPRKNAAAQEPSVEAQHPAFEEFARRWSKYLYTGQLAVMRELYQRTIARGTTDCFTSYNELAIATKMTRRNCIKVVNFLVDRGFIERLEVRNNASGKGITLRIYPLLEP
jgi:hypothetical protein